MTFVPLRVRARWAIALLALSFAVDAIAIWFDLWEIRVIDSFQAGTDTTTARLASSDNRQAVIGGIQVAVVVATAIAFISWFSRAYRNVAALGAEQRFKPGWAIGGWFVPLLSFWRPKQIADEIWRASLAEGPVILTLWWGCWLLSAFVGNFSARVFFTASTLADSRNSARVDLLALIADMAAAALAILVILRITSRQTEHAHRLGVPASSKEEIREAEAAPSHAVVAVARPAAVAHSLTPSLPLPNAEKKMSAIPLVIFQMPDGTEGGRIPITREMLVGREDADIIVAEDEVSRRHATIVPRDGGLEITDLDSTNGTRVNGRVIEQSILRNGDIITVGLTSLRVSLPAPEV